ncbi:MAG: hypothetical protein ACRCSS_11970, partial [Shewanella sp.]
TNPYRNRGNKRKVRSQIAIYQYLINYEKRLQQELNAQREAAKLEAEQALAEPALQAKAS